MKTATRRIGRELYNFNLASGLRMSFISIVKADAGISFAIAKKPTLTMTTATKKTAPIATRVIQPSAIAMREMTLSIAEADELRALLNCPRDPAAPRIAPLALPLLDALPTLQR